MAGTFDAGSVVYEVDMDTSRLLAARREVDAALNGLNGRVIPPFLTGQISRIR